MSTRSFSISMPPAALRGDDPWNLRPYDVPWGDDYCDYEPGKLPGHDGLCLVLRSPTPVEQKRTAVACNHCRQRKAKCSGDRPACSRCADRGRRCVYPDPQDRPSQPAHRAPRPARAPRRASASDAPSRRASSSRRRRRRAAHRPKAEPDFDAAPPHLLYDVHGACAAGSPDSGYASPPSTTYSDADEYRYAYARYLPDTAGAYTPPPVSAAIYAPTPVRPGPAEYAYADLCAPHAVFAAGPRLDSMALADLAPYAYAAHGHAYQEPVPTAEHAQYHYAPAGWYGDLYYVDARHPYQAYADQVSYAHAVY